MRYEVYVDVLFGNCLIMEYWILSLTGLFLQRHATRRRRLVCASIGALLTVCCMLLTARMPGIVRSAAGYGLIPCLLLYAAYGINVSREMLLGCVCMYFLTFLYGGCFSFLQRELLWQRGSRFALPGLIAVSTLLYEGILLAAEKLRKRARLRRIQAASRYRVQFRIGDDKVCCSAILDTGNRLYDPVKGRPAAVMDKAAFPITEKLCPKAVIPYRSLGCENGFLYAYAVNEVLLLPEDEPERESIRLEDMLIALYDGELSSDHTYRMLLHPDFFFAESKKETQKRGMHYDIQSGNTGQIENVSSAQGIDTVCAEKK